MSHQQHGNTVSLSPSTRRRGASARHGSGKHDAVAVAGDRRLQPALDALHAGGIDVLTLDVFDTLVWRTVPKPLDAFVLLGQRLAARGLLPSHVRPAGFARLRARAERRQRERAVERGEGPEIDLGTIWAGFGESFFGSSALDDFVHAELELERSILVPDLDIAAFARLAQDRFGVRLALVSDTYFTEPHLRYLLDREPLRALDLAAVFASCDQRVSKASGLWEIVPAELGVEPGVMLHIGDNPVADGQAPAELGVRTVAYEQRPPWLTDVLDRERVVPSEGRIVDEHLLGPTTGDFGLTALRGKALGQQSVGYPSGLRPYWQSGAAVFGPVFTFFAEWVLRRAQETGVDRVYALMREGEFFSRLINAAALSAGSPVRSVPVWMSRQVCARAAIAEGSVAELKTFVERRTPPTVGQLCATLGVQVGDFPRLERAQDNRLGPPGVTSDVLGFLAETAEARAQIITKAAACRSRVLDYFASMTGGATDVVLVDLGWGGTIQERLNEALRLAGSPTRTTGLYLLTSEAAIDRRLRGTVIEGFLDDIGAPQVMSEWVIRSPEILEQIVTCDEGSMLDLSAEHVPVLAPSSVPAGQSLERVAVQQGILAFQSNWSRYRTVLPEPAPPLDDLARRHLQRMLARFIVHPTREEAESFGRWLHDENFGSADSDPVVADEVARRARYLGPRQLLELGSTEVYWPFGAAALCDPALGAAAAAIGGGELPVGSFATDDVVNVRVSVDRGRGWQELHAVDVPSSMGNRYLFRSAVPAGAARAIAVDWGHEPGVLRIDWARFTLFPSEGPPLVVRLDEPASMMGFSPRHAVALQPHFLLGRRGGPGLQWRCPLAWSVHTDRVEIELACEWLPCRRGHGRPPGAGSPVRDLGRRVAERLHLRPHSS